MTNLVAEVNKSKLKLKKLNIYTMMKHYIFEHNYELQPNIL